MSGGKNGPNNSPVVGPIASLLSRQQDYRRKEQWDQMAKGHECQPKGGKGSIPLVWRGCPCSDSSRTVRRLGGCRAQGLGQPCTVMMVVVGVLKKQGLLAKSLCGEPKALHGGGNTGMEHPPGLCKGFWDSVCPLVGMKGDAGGAGLLGADPGKIQFSKK